MKPSLLLTIMLLYQVSCISTIYIIKSGYNKSVWAQAANPDKHYWTTPLSNKYSGWSVSISRNVRDLLSFPEKIFLKTWAMFVTETMNDVKECWQCLASILTVNWQENSQANYQTWHDSSWPERLGKLFFYFHFPSLSLSLSYLWPDHPLNYPPDKRPPENWFWRKTNKYFYYFSSSQLLTVSKL